MNIKVTALVAMFAASSAFAEGDADKGKKNFRKCASCHSVDEGGKNGAGPNLYNIMSRGVAQAEGYKYSSALTEWSEENPVWTSELMDVWLTNSKGLVKGTKMNFKEKNEEKRADLIAYLQSIGVE